MIFFQEINEQYFKLRKKLAQFDIMKGCVDNFKTLRYTIVGYKKKKPGTNALAQANVTKS